ncbi:MAG: TRZ/ATZ family hydrolase [Congregibacter sp.]
MTNTPTVPPSPELPEADFLIKPGWLVTMEPGAPIYEDRLIAIKDDRIVGLPRVEEASTWQCEESLDLPEHALLPGLINAHGHAAMSLLRGFADDLPLMPWLEQHIWPAENAHVSAEFVRDGSSLAMAEMLLSGTTTFSDMYFYPDIVADLCIDTGMRAQLASPIFDFPTLWGSGAEDYISKALELRDDYKNQSRLQVAFGPHAPYTVSRSNLEKVATFAAELDMPVQIHLHETTGEVLAAVEAEGQRPIDTLLEAGLLGPRTQCVHMTDLGQQDIDTLAASGAQVVHCPQSNMKLASGTCPVNRLLEAGINVALGTDGAASNNDLNLFNEMHSAALLAKLSTGDATVMPASSALHMATLGGARALGLEAEIGSIRVGKQADLIAVDLSGPATQPLYNPLSQLVYACTGGEVTHSWVAGQPLMRGRRLLTLDLAEILTRARYWRDKISEGV